MDFAGTALWIILILCLLWLVILITSINGLVRRNDISLPVKIFWGIVISVAPVVGLIIYILVGRRARTHT
jgi:Phospholipase_D-nuclease N-terminal